MFVYIKFNLLNDLKINLKKNGGFRFWFEEKLL